ncbi:HAMP domain-containing sensor histidine kinase [uncultured Clostridium sp.]|uniref:sensor histidine kinase n=1 Tax=uncultured Clostridium sp. TaxID=59620 RepID=UPI00260E748C|nr:HAMP domain-containing sensor histidine kinase [uncultured Clostridium sp.]
MRILKNSKLHKKLHEKHKEHCPHFERNIEEFSHIKRDFLIFKFITLITTLCIITFIFHSTGFASIAFFIAGIVLTIEIINIVMYDKFNRKILKPVKALKDAVLKVSDGDYSVRVENNIRNEIGTLIDEFNAMAEKLEKSEILKLEYENNRKDLIANISHDLKTPITSISGYVDLIHEGEVTDKEKLNKYLDVVKTNCDYMNNLIDDLFLFSKLDMQRVVFDFNPINISYYLDDIMEEFSFIFEEDNQIFSYKNALQKTEIVSLDPKTIYRTIRNIIGNARKYGGKDLKVDVTISTDSDYVSISIKDNGPGIEKEHLENIFERFYRIDKERTKNLMSTGLGLAIAKEIVIAHNGTIEAFSEISKGSEFIIKLPISK